MIDQIQVRNLAKKQIEDTFSSVPSVKKHLLEPHRFNNWIEKMTYRTRMLDLEGFIKSKFAFEDWIKKAAFAYARHELNKMESKLLNASN